MTVLLYICVHHSISISALCILYIVGQLQKLIYNFIECPCARVACQAYILLLRETSHYEKPCGDDKVSNSRGNLKVSCNLCIELSSLSTSDISYHPYKYYSTRDLSENPKAC